MKHFLEMVAANVIGTGLALFGGMVALRALAYKKIALLKNEASKRGAAVKGLSPEEIIRLQKSAKAPAHGESCDCHGCHHG